MISAGFGRFPALFRYLVVVCVLALVPGVAHAAKWYVDNTLGEVAPEEKVVPEQPMPVQVIYEFERDGAPHARATKETKQMALDAIAATGVFSEVVETPVESGAVLSIKFNNVVDKEKLAQAKKDGFKAGLGFGLLGGVVATDNYVVTFDYIPRTGAEPISTTVEHALYMKFGKKDVEIPGTEVKKVKDAINMLVRQVMDRGINNLASDPGFAG